MGSITTKVLEVEYLASNTMLLEFLKKCEVPSEKIIDNFKLEFEKLTTQQVELILESIPSSLKAMMRVEYIK